MLSTHQQGGTWVLMVLSRAMRLLSGRASKEAPRLSEGLMRLQPVPCSLYFSPLTWGKNSARCPYLYVLPHPRSKDNKANCGGLSEKGLRWIMYLNVWFPVGSLFRSYGLEGCLSLRVGFAISKVNPPSASYLWVSACSSTMPTCCLLLPWNPTLRKQEPKLNTFSYQLPWSCYLSIAISPIATEN